MESKEMLISSEPDEQRVPWKAVHDSAMEWPRFAKDVLSIPSDGRRRSSPETTATALDPGGDDCAHPHCSRLKPIVEQESAMSQLVQSLGSGFRGLAQKDKLAPSIFKKRLTSTKRSPRAKAESRLQKLLSEPIQSDSPKGLDQALSPAMLRALHDKSSSMQASQDQTEGPSGQVFQASFTRRYSAKEAICVGEDDVNKAAPHGTQTAKPQETHGTGISLPSLALKGTASATVSLASDVRGIEHSPGSSMEDENDAVKIAANRARVKHDDHLQEFVSSKWIHSISTAIPHSDSGSGSCANSTIPAEVLLPRVQEYVRSNIIRSTKRSLLGFHKSTIFEMYSLKGRPRLSAEQEMGRHVSFAILSNDRSSKGESLTIARLIASPSAESQFLLLANEPGTPGHAVDLRHDPVLMAILFEKSPLTSQRLATVLLPEEKKLLAGGPDLGSKDHIQALFADHKKGRQLKNVKVLTAILGGKELRHARSTQASVKHIQLQDAAEWEEYTPDADSGKKKQRRCCFEFGRLLHNNEFVCDFMKPLLSTTQAMGLAIACSAPRRRMLHL